MKREADRATRTSAHFGARRNARGARPDGYACSGNEALLIAERAAMRHGNQDPKSERGEQYKQLAPAVLAVLRAACIGVAGRTQRPTVA
jgi:hypothetical protein